MERQTYQGGTFGGNHVHKLLKVLLIALFSLANHLDKKIKTSYSQKALTHLLLQLLHTQV